MPLKSIFGRGRRLLPGRLVTLALFGWLLGYYSCAPQPVFAQTVSPFQGLGNAQFFDNNGKPLTGGVLYSFQAGTSTQQATYTDSTGITPNPNPIPFGSGARVSIWLTFSNFYKFVLCLQNDGPACAPGDVLFSVDNVPGSPANASAVFTGIFISQTVNPATSGILRLATADTICWRNQAGSANLCLSKNTNDALIWPGVLSAANFLSSCAPAALTGFIELCDTDTINWRNHANSSDLALSKNTSDNLVWPNGLSLGGGTALASTNQTGSGSLVLAVTPTIATPNTSGAYSLSGPENPTPSAPSSGNQKGYFKAGKGWCAEDSAGVEYCTPAVTTKQVKAIVNVNSCSLAPNGGGEWSCSGTITWGTTLSTTTYYGDCALSCPGGAGSCGALAGGYDAHLFWTSKSTTTMGYIINDDHSGSNGASYNLTCTAIE